MRELSLDEVKQLEFDMLVKFDKVCRENDIKYSLAYGTLLGAIRHKSFIPWDDDIDIMMNRSEYEKFLYVWKNLENKQEYKLFTLQKGSEFWPLFSRITNPLTRLVPEKICNHGVWLAVIPFDNIPDDMDLRKRHLKRVAIGLKLLEIKRRQIKCDSVRHIVLKLLQIFLKPFSAYWIGRRIENLKTKYKNTNCSQVNPWKDKLIVNADIFNDYIDVEFNGLQVMAIRQYDYFLKCMYNDYMKLPPEKERYPKHQFTAYIEE